MEGNGCKKHLSQAFFHHSQMIQFPAAWVRKYVGVWADRFASYVSGFPRASLCRHHVGLSGPKDFLLVPRDAYVTASWMGGKVSIYSYNRTPGSEQWYSWPSVQESKVQNLHFTSVWGIASAKLYSCHHAVFWKGSEAGNTWERILWHITLWALLLLLLLGVSNIQNNSHSVKH